MAELDDTLAQYCIAAIQSSAKELDIDPLVLAKRLREGQIARLARLLNAAHDHVSTPGLRHRIEDLLSQVTDGQMPVFETPESELDWALGELRERRKRRESESSGSGDEPEP